MQFDECTPYPCDAYRSGYIAFELSPRWGERCKNEHEKLVIQNALFGIIQGRYVSQPSRKILEGLLAIGFDGYAIGGLSVGEPKKK